MNRFMYICNMEQWKRLKEHPYFEISNMGRLRKCMTGRILNGSIDHHGYMVFRTKHKGIKYYNSVHRLVALYFIDNPLNKDCVNHIDCDKTNNKVKNLEWCTKQENTDHAVNLGRIPRKAVINTETGEQLKSALELSKYLGWNVSKVKHMLVCNTKNRTAWRYLNDDRR